MLDEIIEEIKIFNEERGWGKDHSPKNLSVSIMIEAAELAECFQWKSQSESYFPDDLAHVYDEVADVFIYLLNFCDKLGIRPEIVIRSKIKRNANKYPVVLK